MNWTSKTVIGLIFVLIGASLVFDMLGLDMGRLLSFLISLALVVWGVRKISKAGPGDSKLFGGAVLIFGLLMMAGQLHLFFTLVVAFVVIYIGFKLLKPGKHRAAYNNGMHHERSGTRRFDPDKEFDEEWERQMNDYLNRRDR